MKKILFCLILLLIFCLPAFSRGKYQGIAGRGGKDVKTSTTVKYELLETYPACTVTVYLTGTTTLASIFADDAGSVKANPFTANTDASYFFYIDNGRYDIKFSGTGIATPYTISDINILESVVSACGVGEIACLNEKTGELVLGADTDATGTHGIRLKTRGLDRLFIANSGNFGFNTITPSSTAILDFNNLPTPTGAIQVFRFRNNEAGSGDFSTSYFATAGSNGETKKDNQVCTGYNVGGPGVVAGEHQFVSCLESRFKTTAAIWQLEQYDSFTAGSESSLAGNWRPRTLTINLKNSAIRGDYLMDSFSLWDKAFLGNGAGSPFFNFNMPTGSGDLEFYGDTGIHNLGTRAAYIRDTGANILYKFESLAASANRLKFWDGASGADSTLNIFAAGSAATPFNMTLMFGVNSVVGANKSIRWNGTTEKFEYEAFKADLSTVEFRPFNDESNNIRNYGLSRALGAAAGDTIEIGSLTFVANGDGNIVVEVFSDDNRLYKKFNISKTSGDSSGTWLEVIPDINGQNVAGAGDLTVDIRNNGTGGHNLRIRRTVLGTFGTQTFIVTVRVLDRINSFVASSATSAGATVAGIYRWIPITNTPLGIQINGVYQGEGVVLAVAANVITPTHSIHHVGAGLIKTITTPTLFPTYAGTICTIPDAAYTTDATGNIAIASTAVVGKTLCFTWSSSSSKWYPSY